MKLELSRYRASIPGILKVYDNNINKPLGWRLSLAAVATNVPVVAVYCFIIEQFGNNEELQTSKDRLIKFYKYSEIV